MSRTGTTNCPNCGIQAEWNGDSNIECAECGIIKTEIAESDPYVVEHTLDGEVIDRVELAAAGSEPENYRFVVACKQCGVCDDKIVPYEKAADDRPLDDDPAMRHYERTDHTCLLVNYTISPDHVREMLDDGSPQALDFTEIMDSMTGGQGVEQ